jgi:putative membrane protein insertion efficiency factor
MPPRIEGPHEENDVSSAARSEPPHASAARTASPLLRQAVREARWVWATCASEIRAAVVGVLCVSIRVYQWLLSPLLGNCCRFEPSCSRYALLCIERLGPLRGSWLSLRRLLRCHPFCPGGHDPPPEVTS